jgi:hypothetical protein
MVNLRRFHELEPQKLLESDASVARCGAQLSGRALLTAQQMSEVGHAYNGTERHRMPFY